MLRPATKAGMLFVAMVAIASCASDVSETRYTDENQTASDTSSTPEVPAQAQLARATVPVPPPREAASATPSADPFTGKYEGSWFNVSGIEGWRVPAMVEFRSVTPTSVSILYTQLRGFGSKGAESVNPSGVMARDLPRDGSSFSHPVSKGRTVVFSAEDNSSIKMELFDTDEATVRTGRLWRVPERTPDIPAQLVPLKGIWSGDGKSDTYPCFGLTMTMAIDVFSEGPHFVVAVDYQYDSLRTWDCRRLPDGAYTFVEHLGPEDPPSMRWFKTMDVVLQSDDTLSIKYRAGNEQYPHTVSANLKKQEPLTN